MYALHSLCQSYKQNGMRWQTVKTLQEKKVIVSLSRNLNSEAIVCMRIFARVLVVVLCCALAYNQANSTAINKTALLL